MSFIIAIIVLSILKLTFTIGRFIAAKRLKLPVEKFVIGIDWGKPVFAKKFNDTELIIYPLFFGGYLESSSEEKCTKGQKALLTFSSIIMMLLSSIIIGLIAINFVPSGNYDTIIKSAPETSQFQAGDKILNVNGTNITGANTLKSVINKKNNGFENDVTIVQVERDGKTTNLKSASFDDVEYQVNTIYSPKSEVLKNFKKNLTFKFDKKSFTKNLISIVAMLLLISILVLVHEAGHFLAAKLFKIKVERFGFGLPFGPILWQKQCGETLVVVHAFLLGGYVSFPDDDKDNTMPKDSPERFANKPIYQRFVVVSAGVFANILCAIFIVILTALCWGKLPTENYDTYIKALSPKDNAAITTSGLKQGDKIVEINGSPIDSAYAFQLYAIKSRKFDGAVSLDSVKTTLEKLQKLNPKFTGGELLPAGTLIKLPKTTSEAEIHLSDDMLRGYERITDDKITLNDRQKALRNAAEGKNTYKADGLTTLADLAFALSDTASPLNMTIERDGKTLNLKPIYANDKGVVGVELDKKRVFVETKTLKSAVTESWNYLYSQTKMLLKGLWQLFSGKVPLDNMHGVVAVVKYGGDVIQQDGFWQGLLLTALISLDLAIVNFLPIPALDGGHVMFLIIEKLYGRPLDEEMVNSIATAGFMFLILLMVIVLYNDIVALAMHKI
ncbi:MAG: RIP metalloprotease RseP [Fusobacterium sp.]|nr:RIP metalloprotease RseP [Fusobacterium sp.]